MHCFIHSVCLLHHHSDSEFVDSEFVKMPFHDAFCSYHIVS